MNRRTVGLATIVVLIGVGQLEAAIITVNYSGKITEVVGNPFGLSVGVGDDVTGAFSYDPTTSPLPDNVVNNATFPALIPTGYVLNVQGSVFSSSNYVLDSVDNVSNFGGSDLFRAIADSDFGQDSFVLDNTPATGSMEVVLADLDNLVFPTNAAVDILPDESQLNQIDLVFGFVGVDEFNYMIFSTEAVVPDPDPDPDPNVIPEPSTYVIFAGLIFCFGLAGWWRKRRA